MPRIFGDAASDDVEDWAAWQARARSGATTAPRRRARDDELDFGVRSERGPRRRPRRATGPDDPFFDLEDDEGRRRCRPRSSKPTGARHRHPHPPAAPTGVPGAARRSDTDDSHVAGRRGTAGRDMGLAIGVGVVLAAFVPHPGPPRRQYLMVLVVLALVAAAVEFFDTLREQGYQPATLVGLVAVAGLPLAAYWRGEAPSRSCCSSPSWPRSSGTALAAGSTPSPLPNTAVTLLGIGYVGLLGSFAALHPGSADRHETIVIVALPARSPTTSAACSSARRAGKTPLAPWISPNKTVEGLVGGMLARPAGRGAVHFTGLAPWDEELRRRHLARRSSSPWPPRSATSPSR